jgi:nucleotide-binding universal stress UspA family protein
VIVATIGLSMGALSHNLFTMIVTMAVVTTMAMPPTLRWALSRLPMRKQEKQRLDREEMEARGFVPNLERLLLSVDGSANGKFATRICGMIAGYKNMPTTVMQIKTDKKTGKAAAEVQKQAAATAGETIQEIAAQTEPPAAEARSETPKLDVTAILEKAPSAEAVAEEAEKGYSLLLIGLEKTVTRRNQFHDDVTNIAAGFEGPLSIVDARNAHLKQPLDEKLNILAPVNGTETSRRAAEIAIVLARASKAPITALYVAPSGKGKKRARQYEEAILKDIVALAETYDVTLHTAVRANLAAEEAIIKQTARGRHNLIVLGAGRRPGEKLFFGDTAAALIAKSERSLMFVAS